jgi:formamidopyrimidine-DNA glycosylase
VPELPDIAAYIYALQTRIVGQPLERVRIGSPFLLRTAEPPISCAEGREVRNVTRIGKRITIELDGGLWLVLHLMIAARLHWKERGAPLTGRTSLAAFDFPNGSLVLTEAGTKHRASLQLVNGSEALQALDPGGIDVFGCSFEQFRAALVKDNHTLKRVLTDPRVIDGIGNAYSDEILHAAHLSPLKFTKALSEEELHRLYDASRETLKLWTDRLVSEAGAAFPEHVTAFRNEMAVHGRYNKPCPVCGTTVQRIRYADNETNYCPTCQTGGKVLADRSLSRILKNEFPRTLEELEALRPQDGSKRRTSN